MNTALTPYLFLLYLSVSICWFLGFYAWRRRHILAAIPFAVVMFSAGAWAFFYGLELVTPSLAGKLFWFNFKQLGASILGPAIFYTALKFTSQRVQFPRLLWLLLWLEPSGTQFVYWTNSVLGFAGTPLLITELTPFPLLYFEYGPWYWFSAFVRYLLLTTAILIFATHLPGANRIYRRQLVLILTGLMLPWLLGVLVFLGLADLEFVDSVTFLFPFAALFLWLGLFRYQLMQLSPVAYAAVFSSIRAGIIIVDDNFHILELNPAALNLLGLKKQALIGQPLSDIFPVWDTTLFKEASFNKNLALEFYYEQGKQHRYLELNGGAIVSNIYDAAGHVLILYDVTDRKLAEKASQLSEARYRTIFETDSAATVIIEEDMTISLANDQFAALSGYARQEIEGKKKWPEFVHENDLAAMEAYHEARRRLDSSVPNEYEFRFVDRYGRIKDVYISVALLPDSTISIASLLDITDRKLSRLLLEQRATDLEVAVRAEQERSAIILQSVSDAIAVSDLDLKTIYVNPSFSRLTGYDLAEVWGKPAQFILNGRIPEQTWRALQETIVNQTVWEGELQFKRKNNTAYDAAVLIAPMRDGHGKLIGFVSSHRDITQAKMLEEARRRLITNISHELRTPVTNIKLYTDLLQRNFNINRKDDYFTTLNEQINRLENIIQNSLEIVALEDDPTKLKQEPIDWGALSQTLQEDIQPRAAEKNIQLHFSPQLAQLPVVMGDPPRISQALYELIHNAISFNQPGGKVRVHGEVQTVETTQWLTLSVVDDGPGIDPSEQERIFDRFYRGKQAEADQIPGTGLGLSRVALIAQAHNGRLTLQKNDDQGSTFILWLPLN